MIATISNAWPRPGQLLTARDRTVGGVKDRIVGDEGKPAAGFREDKWHRPGKPDQALAWTDSEDGPSLPGARQGSELCELDRSLDVKVGESVVLTEDKQAGPPNGDPVDGSGEGTPRRNAVPIVSDGGGGETIS